MSTITINKLPADAAITGNELIPLWDPATGTTRRATLSAAVAGSMGLVNLTTQTTGNLPVSKLNSGTGASNTTFWRGDGTWGTPTAAATPGGTSGQIQLNTAGALGGFTPGGDLTFDGASAFTVAKIGGQAVSLGGAFSVSGAFTVTLNVSANTNLTLPTSGTVTALGNTTTGTGAIVQATSPALVTPSLGAATASSINKVALTQPASGSTLTIADGKTLTANSSVTLGGTDGAGLSLSGAFTTTLVGSATATFTLPGASDTLAGLAATQTFTNKRITQRTGTTASGSTITPAGDTSDMYTVTALAAAATIAAPSGTPTDGQKLLLRLKDNGTARALTWTTTSGGYRAVGVTLPSTTVISKVLYVGCVWNAQDSFWDVIAVGQQ